jgi:NitT/TauT family transport system permease protein
MSFKFSIKRKERQNPSQNETDKYWKPKSKIWFFASILSLVIALAINLAIPNVQFVNTLPYQIFMEATIVILLVLWFVSIYFDSLRNLLYHKSQFIFAAGIAFCALDLLTTKSGIFTLPFFPGPPQVINIIHSERNMLLISTYYSMRLFFVGLISGTLLGIFTGILIGWYRQWYYWLYPIIKITGVIPPVAWIPIAIVIFPSSFITGLFLITMASWFSIAFMVATGIASTPKVYFEVARTLGANERFLLFHVALPNAVPNIFMGLSMATGLSFLTLIVSEMVGAKAGLGFYISWAKAWSAYDKVYASIIIMAVAFSIILAIISVFRNYFLRWQKGILK